MQELYLLEILLTAGAEMKRVKDTMVETADADQRTKLIDLAQMIQHRLGQLTPVLTFLTQESVAVLREVPLDSKPEKTQTTKQ